MELETAIVCPLIDNKSRLNLADLNVKPTDPIDVSDKFMVRMTMINKCVGSENKIMQQHFARNTPGKGNRRHDHNQLPVPRQP